MQVAITCLHSFALAQSLDASVGGAEIPLNLPPFAVAQAELFSPPNLQPATLAECLRAFDERGHGKFIVPDQVVDNLSDRKVDIEIDLRTSTPSSLSSDLSKAHHTLQFGGTVVIRNLGSLDPNLHAPQAIFDFTRILRLLEQAVGPDSLFIVTVEAGKALPSYTAQPFSPFGLSCMKIGFELIDRTVAQPTVTRPLLELDNPVSDISRIYGTKRNPLYRELIAQALQGENILLVGPRRGGKSSFINCLTTEAKKSGIEIFVAGINDFSVRSFLQNSCFTDLREEDITLIEQANLEALPSIVKNLINSGRQLSGRRAIILGDELLEIPHIGTIAWYNFAKDIKELNLPISVCATINNFSFYKRGQVLTGHPNNPRDAHLSAFKVHEIGLLDDLEAKEVLNGLVELQGLTFQDERAKKHFTQTGLLACSNSLPMLTAYVADAAKGKSLADNLRDLRSYGARSIFGVYFKYMSPLAREIIAYSAISNTSSCIILNPESDVIDELSCLTRMGYIKTDIIDDSSVRVTLIPKFFLSIVKSIIESESKIKAYAMKNSELIAARKSDLGASEQAILNQEPCEDPVLEPQAIKDHYYEYYSILTKLRENLAKELLEEWFKEPVKIAQIVAKAQYM